MSLEPGTRLGALAGQRAPAAEEPLPRAPRRAFALDRAYDGCLRLADWSLGHAVAVSAVAAPAITLIIVAINQLVLQDFPNSGDEYVYLYQAATLAEGRLWNEVPASSEFFQFNYIAHANGKAYGTFPVGWPLLLALAMQLNVPVWLVNPILGTLSLMLIARLGGRLHNARVGVLAACMIGMSAFFLFNAASYYSHTLCGTLLIGAVCLAAREDRSRAWIPLSVGFLLGWAVLVRYLTGVLCGIPICLMLLRNGSSLVRTLALCGLGGLPWLAGLLAYNYTLTGSPWQLTTLPTTMSRWFASGFALRGADILSTQLLRFVLWTPPLLIFVYLVYLSRAARDVRRGAIDWMPVLMAVALFFFVERGGNQYGPRFYHEVFPFLTIFVTACVFRERAFGDKSRRDRRVFGLMAASVAVTPFLSAAHAMIEHRVIQERSDPFRMARESNLEDSLVLIDGRVGTVRPMGARDLTRNGIAFGGSVLYGLDSGPEENCRVIAQYPRRTLYRYFWDVANSRGVLQPITCDRAGAVLQAHG